MGKEREGNGSSYITMRSALWSWVCVLCPLLSWVHMEHFAGGQGCEGMRRDAAHSETVDADDVRGLIPSPCSLSVLSLLLHNAPKHFRSTPHLKFQLVTTSTINNKEMDPTLLPSNNTKRGMRRTKTSHAKDRQQPTRSSDVECPVPSLIQRKIGVCRKKARKTPISLLLSSQCELGAWSVQGRGRSRHTYKTKGHDYPAQSMVQMAYFE